MRNPCFARILCQFDGFSHVSRPTATDAKCDSGIRPSAGAAAGGCQPQPIVARCRTRIADGVPTVNLASSASAHQVFSGFGSRARSGAVAAGAPRCRVLACHGIERVRSPRLSGRLRMSSRRRRMARLTFLLQSTQWHAEGQFNRDHLNVVMVAFLLRGVEAGRSTIVTDQPVRTGGTAGIRTPSGCLCGSSSESGPDRVVQVTVPTACSVGRIGHVADERRRRAVGSAAALHRCTGEAPSR